MKVFDEVQRTYSKTTPRHLAVALGLVSIALAVCVPGSDAFDNKHRLFTNELKKYVDSSGVHYAKWKQDTPGLIRYMANLADITPAEYDKLTFKERAALWMNAYDAQTIKTILDHYPIKGNIPYYPENSPRQIVDLWERFPVEVAGRKLSLYQIEHDILRREVKDVRTHFAVSCAAKGCGAAPRSAYTASNWNKKLTAATKHFFADPNNLSIDKEKKEVNVSKIFKWFPLDFAVEAGFKKIPFPPPSDDQVVLGYLAQHGPKKVRAALRDLSIRSQYKVNYRNFDWSLNDADVVSSTK